MAFVFQSIHLYNQKLFQLYQGKQDSNNMGRNHNDSFAAIIDVDGSTNVQVNVHTTDPGDSGGADYRYRINIYKIG